MMVHNIISYKSYESFITSYMKIIPNRPIGMQMFLAVFYWRKDRN